jgi:hypothetical protein
MKNSIENFAYLLSVSACFWSLFLVYMSIRIHLFIVKRYEKETDLLDTVYFKEHATFTKSLPGFMASALYMGHLLSFIWWWDYCRNKRPYRDIKESVEVIRYFAAKEIRRVKWFAIGSLILIFHGGLYILYEIVWPEVFS